MGGACVDKYILCNCGQCRINLKNNVVKQFYPYCNSCFAWMS